MDTTIIGGIVRAVLAAAGGTLVAHGYIGQTELEALVGALVVVGTGVWSVYQKVRAKKSAP